jgi:hypothetical protein
VLASLLGAYSAGIAQPSPRFYHWQEPTGTFIAQPSPRFVCSKMLLQLSTERHGTTFLPEFTMICVCCAITMFLCLLIRPPYEMREAQGGVMNGRLYVFGGFIDPFWGPNTYKSLSYSPQSNSWQTHPNMPLPGNGVRWHISRPKLHKPTYFGVACMHVCSSVVRGLIRIANLTWPTNLFPSRTRGVASLSTWGHLCVMLLMAKSFDLEILGCV